jgi:hypothetical protein
MMTDGASCYGTKDGVMARVVASNPTYHSPFDAPLCVCTADRAGSRGGVPTAAPSSSCEDPSPKKLRA